MKKFIGLAGDEFMANAAVTYGQGWLVMDLMHTGDEKWQELGKQLITAWEKDEDPYVAQMDVFANYDLDELDQALSDHLYEKESQMRRGR